MRTDIAYVNCRGERIEFGGTDDQLHYFEHELRNWEWTYGTGAAGDSVTSFSRRPSKPSEKQFPVGVAAKDGESGIELRNRIDRIGEADVAAMAPGRLYVGDRYVKCWIIAGEPTNYWLDDRFYEVELTLLVEDPGWVLERERRFVPETGSDSGPGEDFPFDFPVEFKRERLSKYVENEAMFPCDFLWRVYGPATAPYIRIAGNLYKVNVDLSLGDRLEVSSADRTIRVVNQSGVATDAYGSREKGAEGSGSYVFQKIPAGDSSLAWDNSFAFDLVTYDVVTQCPWEE